MSEQMTDERLKQCLSLGQSGVGIPGEWTVALCREIARLRKQLADICGARAAGEHGMNIKELLTAGLKANGYDGLVNMNGDPCGCLLGDLMPCENFVSGEDCQAGYKGPPTPDIAADGGTWAIYLTKEAAQAAQEKSDAK